MRLNISRIKAWGVNQIANRVPRHSMSQTQFFGCCSMRHEIFPQLLYEFARVLRASLAFVRFRENKTALFNRIAHVFFMRSEPEMRRIAAFGNVARMTNILSYRDNAMSQLPSNSMREGVDSVYVNVAIPLAVTSTEEQPAFVWRAFFHFHPKTLGQSLAISPTFFVGQCTNSS